MKIHVNLYKPSGKWAYGDLVEISGLFPVYDPAFKQELINNQNFVLDGVFEDHIVVTSHTEEWMHNDEPGFYNHLWFAGSFGGLRKAVR